MFPDGEAAALQQGTNLPVGALAQVSPGVLGGLNSGTRVVLLVHVVGEARRLDRLGLLGWVVCVRAKMSVSSRVYEAE